MSSQTEAAADLLLRAIVAACGSIYIEQTFVVRHEELIALVAAHLSSHPDCRGNCACYQRGYLDRGDAMGSPFRTLSGGSHYV